MTIDVSQIIKITGARIDICNDIDLQVADFLGGSYKFPNPLKAEGEIYNNGKSLTLSVHITGKMETECARCLKPIEVDVDYTVHELLSRAEDNSGTDDDIIIDGYEVDIDAIAADNFIMNISGKYLCSDDCKGLCPTCGHDLNEGECGCDNEYIDPRWQALADIINNKE